MGEAGDRSRESFQRLAAAELAGLCWLARRLVRDSAEDLVQEALLNAYRRSGPSSTTARPDHG
jgi:DNA-directed RNA polymerase specialized sigma24 family protein